MRASLTWLWARKGLTPPAKPPVLVLYEPGAEWWKLESVAEEPGQSMYRLISTHGRNV
ncbi:MAG: hypothetical protein SFW67_28595 [Myxococcaceae bacterium]|nr:hypothetical protein [Myxococcaceae bacterium]